MGLNDVLDFSTSVNPLGMHHAVRRRILDSIDEATQYPDAAARTLEKNIASYMRVHSDWVVAGNGATEIIHNICRILAGQNTMAPSPGFGEYGVAASLCGSAVSTYDAYPNGLPESIPPDCCVFVCNPSNPAGELLNHNNILEMCSEAADVGSTLVVDECFIEMTPGRDESIIPYIREYDNVVVLRSLTKSFGLAGLRVGYCIAGHALSTELRRIRIPWSVNALGQAAAVEALAHQEHLKYTHDVIRREVGKMYHTINDMAGITALHTDANYFVARTRLSAPDIVRRLLNHKILVRDCSSFGMDHHIRISVKTHDKNKILLDALKKVCTT